MRHSFPERSLFLQIMIGISSVALVSAMTGTGMMNSQPSEYQQIAYAQEVCEWSESSCVGDYMGDDAGVLLDLNHRLQLLHLVTLVVEHV